MPYIKCSSIEDAKKQVDAYQMRISDYKSIKNCS